MVLCEVDHAGTIYLHKKVFVLEKEIVSNNCNSPLGVKDIIDISKAVELGINIFSALVNNASNIEEIKELITDLTSFKLLARIETSEAIYNFDSILEKADGIVLHHGLLSSKIPYEDLCLVESYILEKCKIQQKPIFIQTGILKSMTSRYIPNTCEIFNLDYSVTINFKLRSPKELTDLF